MEKPLVSIIMGVYNGEACVARCINSIINQTYDNWEFIICDDCSTDKTFKIINDFAKNDKRIILIRNAKNSRLAASLNHCLEYVKGKYVARMDADDESLPQRLEKQVEYMELHPECDCLGSALEIWDGKKVIGIRKMPRLPEKECLKNTSPFAHPTIMMKRSVYCDLRGYTVSKATARCEDLDLWFRFYAQGYSGDVLQEPLYRYTEALEDFKKRTFSAALGISKVYINGYRLLNFPFYYYVFALKPIISAILPGIFMKTFHNMKDKV